MAWVVKELGRDREIELRNCKMVHCIEAVAMEVEPEQMGMTLGLSIVALELNYS